MNLRPYQAATVAGIKRSFADGNKRPLIVSPTGSGKSWTIAYLLKQIADDYQHAMVLVHRREIIFQLSQHLDDFGQFHGLILASEKRKPSANIQVGSIQTFASRYLRQEAKPPRADWIIIDEAHLSLADTYQQMLDLYPDAKVMGFTATPVRGDGRGMGEIYDDLVIGADVEGLVEAGYLVPTKILAPTIPDLTGVTVRAGDWARGELEDVMDNKTLVGNVVDHWLPHRHRKTVVFTTGVKHSMHVCEKFREAGIRAEHIDGTTDDEKRDQILHDLVHGDLQVVTNCDVLTTGWDAPPVSCMVMLRPTKSYGLYLQMAGRILRPAPGKEDALIIDHGGNVYRHGFPEDASGWSLDPGERIQDRKKVEREEKQPTTCRNCWTVYTGRVDCPSCGWVPTVKSRAIDVQEGRLVEIKRGVKKKEDKEKIWRDCLFVARHKNMKVGAAAHMYRKKTGVWPRQLPLTPKGDEWKLTARQFLERNYVRQ